MTKYYTYIAYNSNNELQGIGVTNNLERRFRLLDTKSKERKNESCKLVYYEEFTDSNKATKREMELTNLHESIIKELIAGTNPMFVNLLVNISQE